MTTKQDGHQVASLHGQGPLRHQAPRGAVRKFPKQPTRKDGLGTMCTEHWRAYVKGLREARQVAKVSEEGTTVGGGEEADAA
jgi:hypothetical protein